MTTSVFPKCLGLFCLLASATLHAQSPAQGTLLLKEDFSTGTLDPDFQKRHFSNSTFNIPETWELRDGALACIYDGKAHPGKAHGKSIDPKFKAHNVRVSYRINFGSEGAMMDMIINAPLKPGKPGSVLWHIGDVVTRVTKPGARDDVSIGERDFTRDVNHPGLVGKKLDPAILEKPEGTFGSAYGIPGASTYAKLGLETGKWYQFVVENIGTKWTLWVDGKEARSLEIKRSDCDKESINFIGFGPFLLDDIVVEELPR
jgi:hypothetical protein